MSAGGNHAGADHGPVMVLHRAQRVTLADGRSCLVESTVYRPATGPNYCARSWFGRGWGVHQTLIAAAFGDDAATLERGPHDNPRHLSNTRAPFELVGVLIYDENGRCAE